jgi:hypothetical protein
MNSRSRLLYSLAAALLLLASCQRRERYTARVERTWPASAIHRLEVHEVNGTITIDGAAQDSITLVANIRSRGVAPRAKEENQGFFRAEVADDTLAIGRRRNNHGEIHIPFFETDEVTIDYELHVPQSVALELRTVNGRIATKGVDGEMYASTVNGPIDVETGGAAELTAKTVNGRVRARFVRDFQGAKLKTVNGEVHAILPASASFNGDFSQVNGDFEASFPMSIHSNPGSRRVSGQVNGGRYELKISTVNGDIQVENGAPVVPAVPAVPAVGAPPVAPAAPAAPAVPTPATTR